MKVVILAGGFGSRLSEETSSRPKPMIEIGGRPIIWHIMKIYSHFGFYDFIVCLGYKGYMIKEYFSNYLLHVSNVTIDMKKNKMKIHENRSEPWSVSLIDTGEDAMTGGRIKKILPLVGKDDFLLTYGDGLADVDIRKLIKTHREGKRWVTLTAVQPPGRFGALEMEDGLVTEFTEKPRGDRGWINGGFFVVSPKVKRYLKDEATVWEKEPLERLARDKKLLAYPHTRFWHPIDTLRDKKHLEKLWESGRAPWKIWND